MEGFRQICSVTVKENILAVNVYKSVLSGVTIYHGEVNSPVVKGYFTIPTEARDDSGCPHVLEHLTFLGSKLYPYKGFLDAVANRSLAQGTNAWTATDHTCYTLATAGYDGFLNVLPIYLDHIIRPTLKNDMFLTEVHHIDAKGKNCGVVYSEMQSHESDALCILERRLQTMLYPEDCGYRYDTGGVLKHLRTLNNDTIKDYHSKYYRWSNLAIVVIGKVPIDKLLATVSDAERITQADSTVAAIGVSQPFSTTVGPMTQDGVVEVEFPSNDEDSGTMAMSFRGPAWSEFNEREAIDIMGLYLTDSNTSPLWKAFLEIDAPLASSVELSSDNFKETCFSIILHNVPSDKLKEASCRLQNILEEITSNPLDMERMVSIIRRESLSFSRALEVSPHDTVVKLINEFAIYGDKDCNSDQLMTLLDLTTIYAKLETRSEDYWRNILQRWIVDAKHATVLCRPSRVLAKQLRREEKELVKEQLRNPGLVALADIEARVAKSQTEQNAKPPTDVVDSVPFASYKAVTLFDYPSFTNFAPPNGSIDTNDASNESLAGALSLGLDKMPFCLLLNPIPSEFITIVLAARIPDKLTEREKQSLGLLAELIFQTDVIYPLSKDTALLDEQTGQLIPKTTITPHDVFTEELLDNAETYNMSLGFDGKPFSVGIFGEFFVASVVASKDKADVVAQLLSSALFGAVITEQRLRVVAKKLLASTAKKRQSGKFLLFQIEKAIRHCRGSVSNACGLFQLESLLKEVVKHTFKFVKPLQDLQIQIFQQQNIFVHVTGNIGKHEELQFLSALTTGLAILHPKTTNSLSGQQLHKNTLHKTLRVRMLAEDALPSGSCNPFGNAICVGLNSIESGFLSLSIPGPFGYKHPAAVALTVFCEYISAIEGPLYRATRGSGFSYGCRLVACPYVGELSLYIYPASDVVSAYKKCMEVLRYHTSEGVASIDSSAFEAAKSSTIYSIIGEEKAITDYCDCVMMNCFKDVPKCYNRSLLVQVDTLKVEEAWEAVQPYIAALCSFTSSPTAIDNGSSICLLGNSGKVKSYKEAFADESIGIDFNVVKRESLFNWISAGDMTENVESLRTTTVGYSGGTTGSNKSRRLRLPYNTS